MTTAADELIALDRAAQDLLFRAARTADVFTGEPVGATTSVPSTTSSVTARPR
nr:hypothetical protein [Micromonospora provocatoris]